jgi:hypothetical protein
MFKKVNTTKKQTDWNFFWYWIFIDYYLNVITF